MRSRHIQLVCSIGTLVVGGIVVGFVFLGGGLAEATPPARTVIVIDPGHGGMDPGVVVDGIHEADVNLDIARRVCGHLQEDPRVTVLMTRNQDRSASHEQRIAMATKAGAAAYVSIHANAFASPHARGIETWVDEDQQPGSESWSLAEILQAGLVSTTGRPDRGVRSMALYLGRLRCPAVLVEAGFLTNPAERQFLLSAEYQETIAASIATGILSTVETLRSGTLAQEPAT